MSLARRAVRGLAGLLALAILAIGVPLVLARTVGNPWPGRDRLDLRDQAAVVTGLLALVAWVVWGRFVVAVATELPRQVSGLRARVCDDARQREFAAPVIAPGGVSGVAQRLVAAVLLLTPLTARAAPVVADTPELRPPPAISTLVPAAPLPATRAPVATPGPAIAPVASVGPVTVAPGDTLISLSRRHLGEAARWREIFELNRDRVQPGGGRLTSPSTLSSGWQLYLPPATVTVAAGDTLWDLTHDRLVEAGAPHDDGSVADHLDDVIALNAAALDDPDVIFVGERFDFPAVGSPPEPAPTEPATTVETVEMAEPVETVETVEPAGDTVASTTTTSITTTAAPPPTATTTPAVVAPVITAPTSTTSMTSTTSSTSTSAPPVVADDPAPTEAPAPPAAPSPVGIGEAAFLSAGVLALLAARRRRRLRAARPRARVPAPAPQAVATERRLRAVDAGERLLRVDVAVRAAAAALVDGGAQITVVRVSRRGVVELALSAQATLPAPWQPGRGWWVLPGSVPVELLAEAARSVGAPCVALTQLGVDADGRDVLVDLEALGLLSIAVDDPPLADTVLRGVAATLATSTFAEAANLVGVGLDRAALMDHPLAHEAASVDDALELAATLVGTTATARHTTFTLRARHTSGEAWEPAVVLVGSAGAGELTPEVVRAAARRRGGLAVVVAGAVDGAPWTLRAGGGRWVLEPLDITLVPVGLSAAELDDIQRVLHGASAPLIDEEPQPPAATVNGHREPPVPAAPRRSGDDGPDQDDIDAATGTDAGAAGHGDDAAASDGSEWDLLVRLLGPVEVQDRTGRPARFERSKTLELIAWLTLHRGRSTRGGARTALWETDVRDATFANVVSEARRAMARHVAPPDGEEWLGRTMTELLPLHRGVVADADIVRASLDRARLQPPELAIATLRPAVELIRGAPFADTAYLWPDAEGITSQLVVLGTGAATELAGHYLSHGDIDDVFWATGRGLMVLPGQEELIALRMRAHARAGDLSGVRLEWEAYERFLDGDSWIGGEPAPKLVRLRRELLTAR